MIAIQTATLSAISTRGERRVGRPQPAVRRPAGPRGLRALLHTLRALEPDRGRAHAVRADDPVAALAADVRLAVGVPVTGRHPGEPNSYINGGRQFQADPVPPYPGTSSYFTFSPGPSVSGAQVFPGYQPTDAVNASRNIYGAYGDIEFNAGKFTLGAAARFETYDELDSKYDNLSGKVTGRVELSKQFAVRASASTGFRAPSLHQRYFQKYIYSICRRTSIAGINSKQL